MGLLLHRRQNGADDNSFAFSLTVIAACLLIVSCSAEGALTPPADIVQTASTPLIQADPPPPAQLAAAAVNTQTVPREATLPSYENLIASQLSGEPMAHALPRVQAALPSADAEAPDGSLQGPPAAVAQDPPRQVAYVPRLSQGATPAWLGGMPQAERACRKRLKRLGVVFEDIPRIGNGGACGIEHPVKLTGLSGGIEVVPAAKLNCQVTEAFAQWVKSELAPAARIRYLSGIRSIHQMSSYSCRTMNSRRGAPMSEHARGNAIDIGKITLNSGRKIAVRKPGLFAFRQKGLLNSVRADSCKYFTTVLGPGSDRHHKDHFHFDLRARKGGARHCD